MRTGLVALQTLGIFAKQPEPGAVKTRLAATVGGERAARLYSAMLRDIVRTCRKLGDRRVLAYAPFTEAAAAWFRQLGDADYEIWAQPAGNLGDRMSAWFQCHLLKPGDRAVLIGSDCPQLSGEAIRAAWTALTDHDVVLAPADDGGYVLIGQRFPARNLFDDIAWSQPTVFTETLKRAASLHLNVCQLEEWADVDDWDDVIRLVRHLNSSSSDHDLKNRLAETCVELRNWGEFSKYFSHFSNRKPS